MRRRRPFGVGQGLDEILFGVAAGVVAFEEGGDLRMVCGGALARQQDGAARKTGFECVQGGSGFSRFGCGAGAELGVGLVGDEARFAGLLGGVGHLMALLRWKWLIRGGAPGMNLADSSRGGS